jgi:hypothetical protein
MKEDKVKRVNNIENEGAALHLIRIKTTAA